MGAYCRFSKMVNSTNGFKDGLHETTCDQYHGHWERQWNLSSIDYEFFMNFTGPTKAACEGPNAPGTVSYQEVPQNEGVPNSVVLPGGESFMMTSKAFSLSL